MYYGCLNSTRYDVLHEKYFYAARNRATYDIRPDYQNQIIHGRGVLRPDTDTYAIYRNAARSSRVE